MPQRRSPPIAHLRAKTLRHNPTEAESKLWSRLRSHQLDGIHFRRQYAIGQYIVDFCALRQKLVIELDGSQHLDQETRDEQRTSFLDSKGFRVLRFWNHEVMNEIESVVIAIELAIKGKE